MSEPTEAGRANRLSAIRQRAADERNTSTAALDRRWLLGEIERLTAERDAAQAQSHADLQSAIKYNAERENAGHVTSKAWDAVTALELERDQLQRELAEEEADREQCAIQEEAKRLDVEDQLTQAERTIRELRDKIEYWEMDQ